jgi:hypothetical protein
MENYRYNYDNNLDVPLTNKAYYKNFLNNRTDEKIIKTSVAQPVENTTGIGGTWLICLIVFFIIIFTIWRYGLLGKAIEKNNTLASLALLSPEIGNALYLAFL